MTIVISQNPYKVLNLREASEEEMLKTAKYFFDKRDDDKLYWLSSKAMKIIKGDTPLDQAQKDKYVNVYWEAITYKNKVLEIKRNPYPFLTWISETLRELHEFTAPANGIIN